MLKLTEYLQCCAVLLLISGPPTSARGNDAKGGPTPELYADLARFHGHTCGGSLMGARLGFAARAALEKAGVTGKLTAKYFSHSCPVDGVQVAAGATLGNRALEVRDRDEHRLTLRDEKSGREVEASLTGQAMAKAAASRELSKKARTLPADSPERRRLEREVEDAFNWLRTAPEAEVVIVKFVR